MLPSCTQTLIKRESFLKLPELLQVEGYAVVLPQLVDGAMQFKPYTGSSFPQGIEVEQSPGNYVCHKTDSNKLFSWSNGPQALKPYLFKPQEVLWRATRDDDGGITFVEPQADSPPLAVIAVRACDIAALKLQDQHFLQQAYVDPYYQKRREGLFLVAVNCNQPSSTCFCSSTGDGPWLQQGADLIVTELDEGMVIQAGTMAGENIIKKFDLVDLSEQQMLTMTLLHTAAEKQMQRSLPGKDLRTAITKKLASSFWQRFDESCLACGNCTAVCPTCFCHGEESRPSVGGGESEQLRQWDSCFNKEHSYIHGLTVRATTAQRYRQWFSHKLASWHEQYGRSGCVGCGRCISWCPVGIDITEQAKALLAEGGDE